MSIVKRFPKRWRITVIVLRGGGRNTDGTVSPPVEMELPDVLFAPNSTGEPEPHSERATATPALYYDESAFTFVSNDRVRLPNGRVYAVEGDPEEWPLGGVLPLRKE